MPETIQRSFTSGEISPSLQSRADTVKYATGLNLCQNFLVRAQGGAYSRPGFRFGGALDDQTKKGRLISFSFNTEQTYMLVFEHLLMRVIKDNAFVIDGAGPALFELVTPYTEAELPFLGITQSADVMTIVHPSHDPADLGRLADDNWTLTDINYASTVTPPVLTPEATATITGITQALPAEVTTSAAHGYVTDDSVDIDGVVGMTELNGRGFILTSTGANTFTLNGEDSTGYGAYVSGGTANQSLRTTGDIAGGGSFEKTYTYVVTAVSNDVESLPSVAATITTKSLSQTFGVSILWAAVAGADYYRVYKDPSHGTDIFGWIGDSNNLLFQDFNIAPLVSDTPPADRTPFDGAGNKPSVVNYYQQRQVFANTTNEPQAVFTTQTGNFESLRTSSPARDDDAVTFTIVGRQVNEIRHIVELDTMLLLTSGGEWKTSEGQEQVLTPATPGAKQQSYNGSSWVPPVVVNSTALYLQEKGARIRDLGYEFSSDKYTGNDLSLMSEHLFEGFEITSMAYSAEPYSILWCVRDDGVLLGLTYQREHQVWGWHQHITDGLFESVATVAEGNRDAVYVIVKRTIDGGTKRYVERMDPREQTNAEDCFYVDSGLTYDDVPATVITGLAHLEGEAVAVLADGNEVIDLTVASGSITIPRAASKVHVGLAYLPAIELLDIDVTSSVDTLKSKSLSVSKVFIEVEKSRGGFIGAKPSADILGTPILREIKPRFQSDEYDSIALKTFIQEVIIDPQWSKGGGVRIEQRSPLPLAILSVIPSVDKGGS